MEHAAKCLLLATTPPVLGYFHVATRTTVARPTRLKIGNRGEITPIPGLTVSARPRHDASTRRGLNDGPERHKCNEAKSCNMHIEADSHHRTLDLQRLMRLRFRETFSRSDHFWNSYARDRHYLRCASFAFWKVARHRRPWPARLVGRHEATTCSIGVVLWQLR
jgi:hypothetical protein